MVFGTIGQTGAPALCHAEEEHGPGTGHAMDRITVVFLALVRIRNPSFAIQVAAPVRTLTGCCLHVLI